MIELNIHNLDRDLVERFLETKNAEACGIDPAMAAYIIEVNDAHKLFWKYPSMYRASRKLMEMHPNLQLRTATRRVSDAISFFHSDCTVTADEWQLFYADKCEELANVALEAGEIKTAQSLISQAHDYRIACSANRVNPDLIKFRPQLISPDLQLDRMGVKKVGLLKAWETIQEVIESRDLSPEDKERLRYDASRELGIKNVEPLDEDSES